MLFVKTFRARQRQLALIHLNNVDMMHDPGFPELCLDKVMQHCLPYITLPDQSDKFQTNSWKWSCLLWYHKHSASSCKFRRHILQTDLIYSTDFWLENITQLTAHWWKIKNILNKIFNNPLFRTMFLCVRTKIIFMEYKYLGLNANIFYWIQVYFLKYQIFFIEYRYYFIKSKYILLNTNIFS